MIGSFYVRLLFIQKSQKGTENYDESNGKRQEARKPGENSKENDGLSEESRADGQQKRMNHHMIRKG